MDGAVAVSMSVAAAVLGAVAVAVAAGGLERRHGTEADQYEEELKEPPPSPPPLPLQYLAGETIYGSVYFSPILLAKSCKHQIPYKNVT